MEFSNLDIGEMERQRYDSIKRTDKYLELNVLIGAEDDQLGTNIGKIPVITVKARQISPDEIACMYVTLKELVRNYEQEYPEECALGLLKFNTSGMKTFTDSDNNKEG